MNTTTVPIYLLCPHCLYEIDLLDDSVITKFKDAIHCPCCGKLINVALTRKGSIIER